MHLCTFSHIPCPQHREALAARDHRPHIVTQLQRFNAKRKLKAGIRAVMTSHRLSNLVRRAGASEDSPIPSQGPLKAGDRLPSSTPTALEISIKSGVEHADATLENKSRKRVRGTPRPLDIDACAKESQDLADEGGIADRVARRTRKKSALRKR